MKLPILLALAGITASMYSQSRHDAGDKPDDSGQGVREARHAMSLFERGRLGEAKAAFWTARLHLTKILGPRDAATLNCRNNFASVLYAMGDYTGAEEKNRAALAVCEQSLGRLHPDSLVSRCNLAVTLLGEGKLEDALENARRVESGRRRVFGADRPEYEEAVLLKKSIENAMECSKQDDHTPRGGPSGLGESGIGVS